MAGSRTALLAVRDLRKGFGTGAARVVVLDGVDMDMAPGETVALRGESGSGKSTLLHIVGALERADSGSVRLDGTEVTALTEAQAAGLRRGTVAVVFQQFNLIPSLDVAANIAFQARLAGRPADVAGLAARLGLEGLLARYPEDLSGGQQQRVAVARALAVRPRLILADEPTGNLDEATGDRVLDLMLDLAAEVGAGLLMVTHSARLAARLSRELVLERGRLR
jgi:putative ABC transport system ATP-binding protein